MYGFIRSIFISVLALWFVASAWAADGFKIQAIRVEGDQRISRDTVLHYLPVHVGDYFDMATSDRIINTLYQTGFFNNVVLRRQGNVLVVQVFERPTISKVTITGNQDIGSDKLNAVFKDLGLVEGRAFDQASLAKVAYGLREEYRNSGHYNATVDTKVIPESRHRAAITITISEGPVAKIKKIEIIGNHAFSTKALLKTMPMSTPNLLSFMTRDDRYSLENSEKSLEALRAYYLDRGYLKFKIDSNTADFSKDKKEVTVVIRITEGDLYTLSHYKLAGNFVLPESELRKIVDQRLPINAPFSRKAVISADNRLGKALGDAGYVFANVNAVPQIDEKTKQISLTIYIDPGQRVYVRRINFVGNTKTADEVLRREMRQMEGGLASVSEVKESKHRLNLLGYLQDIKVKTKPVENVPDQVDLEYSVTEMPSATASAGVGYGSNGFVFNAGLNQTNFMGTGKTVGVAFNSDPLIRSYSFSYNNPYYTIDGIQRGFSVYSTRTTPGRLNIVNYSSDAYGASLNYVIPISAKNDSLQVGLTYQNIRLNVGNAPSNELLDFVNQGNRCRMCNTKFNQLIGALGWNRNSLDRLVFPTRGLNQAAGLQVSGPLSGRPLDYYKTSYSVHGYYPLNKYFILTALGNLAYGNGYGASKNLPFFENYYAGGMGYAGAVRGYASNALGPKDSQNNPLGGNLLTAGSIGVVFPNFISADRLRTTVFFDAGNVYNTKTLSVAPYLVNQHAGAIRYSTGISAEWRIPNVGILNLSVAKPLNPQRPLPGRVGDNLRYFDFSFGTSFL